MNRRSFLATLAAFFVAPNAGSANQVAQVGEIGPELVIYPRGSRKVL